ncbi:MAG TPA: homoserine O-acetyltransferase [Longimicrobiaceae bacterium]|nr:homoserine O-acetyltransferase [Longimicrobiaceae bacterium]
MSDRPLRFQRLPRFALDSGEALSDVVQAYHLDGELNAERDNLVVVFHALTGSADAAEGWWSEVVGPGRAIDTGQYAVLCTNLLGSCYGTTYAGDEPGRPRPRITPRDQARLIHALVEELGVRSVALAVGGSLGGMVAMEWAASFPTLTRATVVLAAPAAHTAAAIGWNHLQRAAILQGGPGRGLELARMIAMMTYRTGAEFEQRFGRLRGEDGFEVASYLAHQGEKLVRRFTERSYLTLMDAMDAHDVGRGRGGTEPALRRVGGRLIGVGIPGDLLYTDVDVRAWVKLAGAEYRAIQSIHGHDAFLIELEQVSELLTDALSSATVATPLHT